MRRRSSYCVNFVSLTVRMLPDRNGLTDLSQIFVDWRFRQFNSRVKVSARSDTPISEKWVFSAENDDDLWRNLDSACSFRKTVSVLKIFITFSMMQCIFPDVALFAFETVDHFQEIFFGTLLKHSYLHQFDLFTCRRSIKYAKSC